MGRTRTILLTDFVWSVFNGIVFGAPTDTVPSLSAIGMGSIIMWCLFAIVGVALLGDVMIQDEAKKRTPVTPITSFDQKSAYGGAFLLILFVGFVGFVIGILPFLLG